MNGKSRTWAIDRGVQSWFRPVRAMSTQGRLRSGVCSAPEARQSGRPIATLYRRKLQSLLSIAASRLNEFSMFRQEWLDVFLVEPSLNRDRTHQGDIYIEVIGRTNNATDEGAVQLVKKSVPYLIE